MRDAREPGPELTIAKFHRTSQFPTANDRDSYLFIAVLNCIDHTPHPTLHTPPTQTVFNPSENCDRRHLCEGDRILLNFAYPLHERNL